MRPNLVIGNPPYAKDIYLDFVTQAHNLSQDSTVMITPAKWQAKAGKKNEEFRDNIVPYMRDIVYYPDTKEVFDIGETGGVCYYIIDKCRHDSKNVKSVCAVNKSIVSNDFEIHDEDSIMLASRKILSIIGKVGTLGKGFRQSLYVKNSDRGETTIEGTLGMKRSVFVGEQERGLFHTVDRVTDNDYVEILQGEKVVGYKRISDLKTTENLGKYKIIMNAALFGSLMYDTEGKVKGVSNCYCLKPYQVPKGSFAVLHYFDTEEECKSFMSYFDTDLVAFLFFFSLGGTSISRTFFRFIPDPKDWTVIYEDRPLPNYTPDSDGFYLDTEGNKHCSLYTRYNLTPDEIQLIESVIKARTKKA